MSFVVGCREVGFIAKLVDEGRSLLVAVEELSSRENCSAVGWERDVLDEAVAFNDDAIDNHHSLYRREHVLVEQVGSCWLLLHLHGSFLRLCFLFFLGAHRGCEEQGEPYGKDISDVHILRKLISNDKDTEKKRNSQAINKFYNENRLFHKYQVDGTDDEQESQEVVPVEVLVLEHDVGYDCEDSQRDTFLYDLELYEVKGSSVAFEAQTIGRYLAAILEESDAP